MAKADIEKKAVRLVENCSEYQRVVSEFVKSLKVFRERMGYMFKMVERSAKELSKKEFEKAKEELKSESFDNGVKLASKAGEIEARLEKVKQLSEELMREVMSLKSAIDECVWSGLKVAESELWFGLRVLWRSDVNEDRDFRGIYGSEQYTNLMKGCDRIARYVSKLNGKGLEGA